MHNKILVILIILFTSFGVGIAARVDVTDSTVKQDFTDANTNFIELYSDAFRASIAASDGSPDPAVSIDADGGVGIGTATPALSLEVVGDNGSPATSGTTQTGINRFRGSITNCVDFGAYDGSPWGVWLQATDTANLATTYHISLNPNGGDVGIGVASPSSILHLYDDEPTITLEDDGGSISTIEQDNSGGSLILSADNGAAAADSKIRFEVDGAVKMTLSGASLGIGTSDPSSVLNSATNLVVDVPGADTDGGITVVTDTTAIGALKFADGDSPGGTQAYIQYDHDNDKMMFGSATANYITIIDSDGDTGIGSSSPDTRLDVNGAITQRELSADPANPDEGSFTTWMSDGTGSGDDGDIMMKITAGGVTKTVTLVDFSAM